MKYLFILVLFINLIFPVSVSAAGLVPCGGPSEPSCGTCEVIAMGNTLITSLIGVLFVVFAIIVVYAGMGLVTSGGNPAAKTAAKSKLTNALIGFIIVLAAWLLVDTIMRGLLTGGDGKIDGTLWSRVECAVQATTGSGVAVVDEEYSGSCLPDDLRVKYGGSPVGLIHPDVITMIACYKADPAVAALLGTQTVYTTDLSRPRCALTNGTTVPSCSIADTANSDGRMGCSHSINSCHYGRGSGEGAKALDFNAAQGNIAGETALYNAIQGAQATCGGRLNFENNHTHISLDSC